MPIPADIRAFVLDVEGTTTPVSFVFDTLFPFARERLDAACARAAEDSRIAEAVERLRAEHAEELDEAVPEFRRGADYARYLMDRDRKSTGLKALQGIIWEDGYKAGTLRAPVFPDVPPALAAWREGHRGLHIYSSGSVLAQKLLFAHTDHGDLTPLIDGYHDTRVGSKREAESYRSIARTAAHPTGEILFLSDVVEELQAAREAGMRTALLVRPGNRPQGSHDHAVHADFRPLF